MIIHAFKNVQYSSFFKQYGMTLLVAVGGLFFSFMIFFGVRSLIIHHQQQEFVWVAQDRQRAIRKGLETAMQAVYELHDLYQSSRSFNAAMFQRIAALIRARHMGIEMLQWVPVIKQSERKAFEAEISQNQPGFVIHERPGNGIITPKLGPKELAPITFIEPEQNQLAVLGYDYFSDPNLSKVLNDARDTGQLTISGRMPMNNKIPKQFGFLAVYPVYQPNAPVSIMLERHNNLAGFIIGFFQFTNLAQDAISMLEPRGVECMILDESALEPERFLHFYTSRLTPPTIPFGSSMNWQLWLAQAEIKSSAITKIANRTWSIICSQTRHFRSAEWFAFGDWFMLVVGIVLTVWFIYYLVRIKTDLAIRTSMAHQLQESERLLSALFYQSPDIIRLVDRKGHSILVNRPPAHGEIEPTEMLLSSPSEFQKLYLHTLERAFVHKETNHFHYRSQDGIWWEIRVVPLQDDLQIVKAMVVATDISENKMLEEQASKNTRLASLGLMAAGVAHEINNPNNSIYYNATLLADAWVNIRPILDEYFRENGEFAIAGLSYAEMREKIPKIIVWVIENTERIKKIVELLKHLSRDDPDCIKKPIDISHVIQSALMLLNNTIQKHTDNFSQHVPKRLPQVIGNSQQLEQVLLNILINALQSLPDRSRSVQLETIVHEINRELILIVRDQGCGIHAAYLEKITEPFFTTRLEQGGTGLGLSISSTIIKNHGGRLRIESQIHSGTTVFIHLPYTGDA